MVVFIITEINYLVVSLFCDLVRAILYLYLWYQVHIALFIWVISRLRYSPCFWHSDKIGYAFTQSHSSHSRRSHHNELFSNKTFSQNSILQIIFFMVLF